MFSTSPARLSPLQGGPPFPLQPEEAPPITPVAADSSCSSRRADQISPAAARGVAGGADSGGPLELLPSSALQAAPAARPAAAPPRLPLGAPLCPGVPRQPRRQQQRRQRHGGCELGSRSSRSKRYAAAGQGLAGFELNSWSIEVTTPL
ncbi:hypothetical protein ABPG75_007313 [Micractinium tetrahymenae]